MDELLAFLVYKDTPFARKYTDFWVETSILRYGRNSSILAEFYNWK